MSLMKNLRSYTDQIGREVVIPHPPQRIISLCPSLTETLIELGLTDRVVGRTKFCIHPAAALADIKRVGGTKEVNEAVIAELNPDLIIAEKEENTKEMVASLSAHYPVFVTDVVDVPSALTMISDVGQITGTENLATQMVQEITTGFTEIPHLSEPLSVAYLIWRNPWMTAGHSNYINALLDQLGFRNVFADRESRYPEVTDADLIAMNPKIVLLSSEPFPFKDKHLAEIQAFLPGAHVLLVDGEMFSWYGVRMKAAAGYLAKLVSTIHHSAITDLTE